MGDGVYKDLGAVIGALVDAKQVVYGNSFEKCVTFFELLYPQGIPPEKMGDALTLVRIFDKIMRIATDRDALGESPYRDIAGYALLGAERVERERSPTKKPTLLVEKTYEIVCSICGSLGCHAQHHER